MLTPKQLKLLQFINETVKATGLAPTFVDMQKASGLKSKSSIFCLLNDIESKGFIRRLPNRARAIEIVKMPKYREKPRKLYEDSRTRPMGFYWVIGKDNNLVIAQWIVTELGHCWWELFKDTNMYFDITPYQPRFEIIDKINEPIINKNEVQNGQ